MENLLSKIDLNVTNRCNFRCIHCGFRSGEISSKELSIEKIAQILKDFKNLGGIEFDITGGEPLVRSDIEKIIKIGKNLGLKIKLVTNGSFLTDKKLKSFKRMGLDGISISLDGSNYEIYKKIRPVTKETFKRVIDNIKKCVNLGFFTKVNTVVFNSNLHDLTNITELCIKLGVKEHRFCYFAPIGRGIARTDEVVDPLKWLEIIRRDLFRFENKIKIYVGSLILENSVAKKINTSCYLQNPQHLEIAPDGNIYPCPIMAFYNKPCGNLYSRNLEEIYHDKKLWDGSYYKNNVMPLVKKFGACVNCENLFKKLIESKNFKFICPVRKLAKENLYE